MSRHTLPDYLQDVGTVEGRRAIDAVGAWDCPDQEALDGMPAPVEAPRVSVPRCEQPALWLEVPASSDTDEPWSFQ